MRQDAWRAYLEMALGVTEASTKKALKTAKKLVGKGGVSADQLQGLADELVRASSANREAVRNLVRVELERAMSAFGLAKADDVETLTARVRELEAQLQASSPATGDNGPVPSSLTTQKPAAAPAAAPVEAPVAAPVAAPVKKTVAKKAVAKKAVATESASGPGAGGAASAPAKTTGGAAPAKTASAPAKAAGGSAPAKAAGGAAPAKKAVKKTAAKAAPSAVGEEITAPAPGPAGPEPRGAAPAKKAVKKTTTKRTPGSGEPVP